MRMKSIKSILWLLLLLLAVAGCGSDDDDDPVRPVVRDFSLPLLYHKVQGTSATASKSSCDITLNTETLALSMTFNIDGGAVPVTTTATRDDERGNFFTFNDVSGGRITGLTGALDLNEQALVARFTLDGNTTVHTTLPGVYFTSTAMSMTASGGATWSVPNAIFQFDINPALDTAMVTFGPFTANDRGLYFNTMRAFRARVAVTPAGYTITGTGLTTWADYRTTTAADGTRTLRTTDYRLDNVNVSIDLGESAMAGHFDIAHTTTDPDTRAVTVDYKYETSVSGKFYKD